MFRWATDDDVACSMACRPCGAEHLRMSPLIQVRVELDRRFVLLLLVEELLDQASSLKKAINKVRLFTG